MYPHEYLSYLVHFHADRDYFECHEILEEYWKSLSNESRSAVWVGLIQIAVGLYHHRRGNFAGAKKMLASAIRILHKHAAEVERLALDVNTLTSLLTERLSRIQSGEPYESLELPITDAALLEACRQLAAQKGLVFGQRSDLSNDYLLHKHTLRDRTDVIEERKRSLKQKQAKNQ